MENKDEVKRPGGPAGIDAVLPEQFKVSTTPTIGVAEAVRVILGKLRREGTSFEGLDVCERPVHRGSLVDMSGARVPFPTGAAYDRCYVALVDPQVDAQWAHPAYWAFVPAEGDSDVVIQATQFPEHAEGTVRFVSVPVPVP